MRLGSGSVVSPSASFFTKQTCETGEYSKMHWKKLTPLERCACFPKLSQTISRAACYFLIGSFFLLLLINEGQWKRINSFSSGTSSKHNVYPQIERWKSTVSETNSSNDVSTNYATINGEGIIGSDVEHYQLPGCECRRKYWPASALNESTGNRSSCGFTADMRGPGQNVVSYSFYGDEQNQYFMGIERNIVDVQQHYPGWSVRVYHNLSKSQQTALFCPLACRYNFVDFCDVRDIAGVGDLSDKFGMIWRFMPLGDDSVNRFLVRDLDSIILPREKYAVQEWIESGRSFHAMRDNPKHNVELLGGMWGGWNQFPRPFKLIRKKIIRHAIGKYKGLDQKILTRVLWPALFRSRDLFSHDSYLCTLFPMTHPFPTQRDGASFVGKVFVASEKARAEEETPKLRRCPRKCRPKTHPDWLYC